MERVSYKELLLRVERKSNTREGWPSWIRRSAFITPPAKVSAGKKTHVVLVKEEPEAPHHEGTQDKQTVRAETSHHTKVFVEEGIAPVALDAPAPAAGEAGPSMAAAGGTSVHGSQQEKELCLGSQAIGVEVVERPCPSGIAIDASVTGAGKPVSVLADVGATTMMSAPEDAKVAVMRFGSLSRTASHAGKVSLPHPVSMPDYVRQATAACGMSRFSDLDARVASLRFAADHRAGDTAVSVPHQYIDPEAEIQSQHERGVIADSARFGVKSASPVTPTQHDKPSNSYAAMVELGGEPIRQPGSTLEFVIEHLCLGPYASSAVNATIRELFPGQVGDSGDVVCCECREPETPETTIVCDRCERSFHLDCVNMGAEEASTVDEWLCNECLSHGGNWKWRLRKIALQHKEGEGGTEDEGTFEAEACLDMEDHHPPPRRMKLPTRRGRLVESQTSPKPTPAADTATSARALEALEGLKAYIAERNGVLEDGWTAQIVPRQHSNGRMHINYWSPNNMMFKTRIKVAEYLGLQRPSSDVGWVRSEHASGVEGNCGRAQHQQPCHSTEWSLPDPKQAFNVPDVATNEDTLKGVKVDACPVSREKLFSDSDSRVQKNSSSDKRSRDDVVDTTKRRKISGGTEESEEWVADEMEESDEWSKCVTSGTQKRPGVSTEEICSFVKKAHQKLVDYVAARGGVLEEGWTTHCMQVKQQTSLQAYYKSPTGKRFQSRVQIGALLNLPARPQSGAEIAARNLRMRTPESDGSSVKLVSRPKLETRPRSKLRSKQSELSNGDDPWFVMKSLIVQEKTPMRSTGEDASTTTGGLMSSEPQAPLR